MQEQILSPEPGTYQADFPPGEFRARREAVFDRIGAEACALVQGAGRGRSHERFRQTNEFYWLCGVETPESFWKCGMP